MIVHTGPPPSQRSRQAGVTMIEMLIAIGVLLVAVMGAYSSQVTSMRLVDQSRERAVALSDLEACMEEVMSTASDTLPVPGSTFEHGQPVASYEELHLRDERIVATYPEFTGGDVPDPLVVRLSASWTDFDGHPRTMDLVTAVTR